MFPEYLRYVYKIMLIVSADSRLLSAWVHYPTPMKWLGPALRTPRRIATVFQENHGWLTACGAFVTD